VVNSIDYHSHILSFVYIIEPGGAVNIAIAPPNNERSVIELMIIAAVANSSPVSSPWEVEISLSAEQAFTIAMIWNRRV
jgi:hypothetical protein